MRGSTGIPDSPQKRTKELFPWEITPLFFLTTITASNYGRKDPGVVIILSEFFSCYIHR